MGNAMEEALGGVLRRMRRDASLQQALLAERAGISAAYLSQIEHGVRHPSPQVLDALASGLSATADDIRSRAAAAVGEPVDPAMVRRSWLEPDEVLQTLAAPDRLQAMAVAAGDKLQQAESAALPERVLGTAHLMVRMLLAHARGDYRAAAHHELFVITAAVLYLVSAADDVPDYLQGGLRDDSAVLTFVGGLVAARLEDFAAWEQRA